MNQILAVAVTATRLSQAAANQKTQAETKALRLFAAHVAEGRVSKGR